MKKSFSIVAAIFATAPVFFGCGGLDCATEVRPMKTDLLRIQSLIEDASRHPENWIADCRNLQPLLDGLPGYRAKIIEKAAAKLYGKKDKADLYNFIMRTANHIAPEPSRKSSRTKDLYSEATWACGIVDEKNPDPKAPSDIFGGMVADKFRELNTMVRNQLVAPAGPLVREVCGPNEPMTLAPPAPPAPPMAAPPMPAPPVAAPPAADPRAATGATKVLPPAPSGGASISIGGSVSAGAGR